MSDTQEPSQLPSTHFQTCVTLEDSSTIGVIVSPSLDGTLQFYLDRPIGPALFGPDQIVKVLCDLTLITTALNQYVNDRIAEAKAATEKETQPELPLDVQPDSVSASSQTCEADACCGGCVEGEDPAHPGQPK
jgi:hypothetical protein